MTSQYRHRRTSNPATVFTNPLEPGEIAVNTANRQIAVGDAASGAVGAPLNLLAVQIFDTRAQYPIGSLVTNAGVLYRSKVAVIPAAFDISQWEMLVGAIDPQYVAVAGDQMTGPLELPAANPTLPVQATHKGYVDAMLAAKSSVIVADAPPTPAPIDSTLWYDTIGGQLYIRYNDGNTVQWVIASPQPNTDQFVSKSGDVMTGSLGIQASGPSLILDSTAAGDDTLIMSRTAGINRWMMALGDSSPEGGVADGSNFSLSYFNNAGAFGATLLYGTRVDGLIRGGKTPPLTDKSLALATTEFVKTWAAPMDALSYSGMQVNGGVEVSQERAQSVLTLTNINAQYAADGWAAAYGSATAVFTVQQSGPGNTPLVSGVYFPNFLVMASSTALSTLGAGDFAYFTHPIEGFRFARAAWGTPAARPVTIGFWIYPTAGGTFSVAVHNGDHTRSYVAAVTLTALTWQYRTITIPGDTSGTWLRSNGAGAIIYFTGAAGTTYQTAAGSWVAGNKLAVTGGTNFFSANANTIYMTGLVVLPDTEAPSAERSPLIMRPYDQELLTCKRYWEKSYVYETLPGTAVGAGACGIKAPGNSGGVGTPAIVAFSVEKRGAPTITIYDGAGTATAISTYTIAGGWINGQPASLAGTSSVTKFMSAAPQAGDRAVFGFDYTANARL